MAADRSPIDHATLGRLTWDGDDVVGSVAPSGLRLVVTSVDDVEALAARLDLTARLVDRVLESLDTLTARAQSVHSESAEQLGEAADESVILDTLAVDETPSGSAIVRLFFRSAADSYAFLALDETGNEFGCGAFMAPR